MNFAKVVWDIPEIAKCLKNGLQALGQNRSKIEVSSTNALKGSVDIDTCLVKDYPNDHRWDYVFGYKNQIYYVEVHKATASEVKNVIKKLKWLKQWRRLHAEGLENLKDQSTYHWISSGKTDPAIGKTNRYRRMLNQNGLDRPKSKLKIKD